MHASAVAHTAGGLAATSAGGRACALGVITEFRLAQPAVPGAAVGTLQTLAAEPLPLIQTSPGFPAVIGAVPSIAGLQGQLAVVCGSLVRVDGETALDVLFALPLRLGAPSGLAAPIRDIDTIHRSC